MNATTPTSSSEPASAAACGPAGPGAASWRFWILLTLCLVSLLAEAQDSRRLEYQVKAAFLYNFVKLVDWPPTAFPNAATPMTIAILGKDPFGNRLDDLVKEKSIAGRRIVVKRIDNLSESAGCHLLFVAAADKQRLAQVLQAVRDACLLTVTEVEPFSDTAGMINFATVQGRVRFEVHPEAAERVHLRLSSKILRLALKPSDLR